MTTWDLGELARAAEAEIRGGALPVSVSAVGTDSRSLPPDCLFVALRGERFDGHAFLGDAVDAGARAVVIDHEGDASVRSLQVPRVVVRDTLRALGDLAAHARRSTDRPVVALTGSNGKTTTKEMIASVLEQRGEVHKTYGNLNNLIGLPLTVLGWADEAWAGVFEMGMNAPGEIARLTEIAAPDVGLVTNVGPAHLEGLGTIEAIARAKGELYDGLGDSATAVLNANDPVIGSVCAASLAGRRVVRFGSGPEADVRLRDAQPLGTGSRVTLEIAGEETTFELPLFGAHNALNATAAAAVAHALGMSSSAIATGLAGVSVPGGRLRLLRDLPRGLHVLDDTYNANPASMRAAFASLAQLATGRRVAVVGDMFELGETAAALHYDVGKAAALSGIAWVVALGEQGAQVAAGATDAGARGNNYSGLEELLEALDSELTEGDWVLVKGSRGMRMERVVSHLEGQVG